MSDERKSELSLGIIAFFLVILLFEISTLTSPQAAQQTPGIQTDQQSDSARRTQGDGGTTPQNGTRPTAGEPMMGGSTASAKCDDDCQRRTEEASEFWTIMGHKTKITDFWLSVFTGLLVLIGGIQLYLLKVTVSDTGKAADAAKDSALAAIESNKLTRAALIAEHRPRFKVTMTPLRETIEYDKAGDLKLRIRVVAKNIGKGVAFGASIPWIDNFQASTNDVQSKIDVLRKSASQWVNIMRHPTYPEEEIEREFPIKIFKDELERTWITERSAGIQNYYVIASLFYRDGFDPPNIYESTPGGYLTFFGPMAPFPRSAEEYDRLSTSGKEDFGIIEMLSKYT
ncbi:hypothetical protein [Hyphomicrobium sp. 2TAF46]|uniref:hypothetical protein n=1 Tax=Hyphomicrobium sp. 2TAF46 TaxID=3233019 RepID=UPI003F937A64